MQKQDTSFFERISRWFRQSLSIKLASIGFIMILLMIPNAMVQDLIYERAGLQRAVVQEVGAKWGQAQTLVGPILAIPFKEELKKSDGKIVEIIKTAYFLPENLKINGTLIPEIR